MPSSRSNTPDEIIETVTDRAIGIKDGCSRFVTRRGRAPAVNPERTTWKMSAATPMLWVYVGFTLLLAPNARAATPQRIVTLAPNLAELVCAAGGCSRLVGVSAYTDFPPTTARIPRIGNAYSVDLEAVLATRPDLVLAWHGGTSPSTIARLRQLGLRVIAPRIRGLTGIAIALQRIGRLLGTRAIAHRAASRFMRRLDTLRRRYAHLRPLRVFYQIGTDPAYTVNRESNVSAILTTCGGRNVFARMSAISDPVSAEAVLARAPQVVLYGDRESRAAIRAYWAKLPATPAARFHAIYPVDSDLVTRASPRVLKGIRQVCRRLAAARNAYATPAGPAQPPPTTKRSLFNAPRGVAR